MSEQKMRPRAHESFIRAINGQHHASQELAIVASFYAEYDTICPADAVPAVIEAFQGALKRAPGLKDLISKAITNLQSQFEEKRMSGHEPDDVDWSKYAG